MSNNPNIQKQIAREALHAPSYSFCTNKMEDFAAIEAYLQKAQLPHTITVEKLPDNYSSNYAVHGEIMIDMGLHHLAKELSNIPGLLDVKKTLSEGCIANNEAVNYPGKEPV